MVCGLAAHALQTAVFQAMWYLVQSYIIATPTGTSVHLRHSIACPHTLADNIALPSSAAARMWAQTPTVTLPLHPGPRALAVRSWDAVTSSASLGATATAFMSLSCAAAAAVARSAAGCAPAAYPATR